MSRLRQDDGSALIVILAVSGILSLLVGASFVLARQSIQVADDEEEVHGALAAAEAGLDDYLFRLNTITGYWQHTTTAASPDANGAFDGFVPVPGGASEGEFRYSVDPSRVGTEGVVEVTSIGRAGGRTRAVGAVISRQGSSFLDHVYLSDFETLSPSAYADPANVPLAQTYCSAHRWADPPRHASCTNSVWGNNRVFDGPFHTNDRFALSGPVMWQSTVTTSDPRTPAYDANGHIASFAVPGDPTYREPLALPTSTADLRSSALAGGCIFTGPTALVLRSDGRITVTSPHTTASGSGCGTWTNGIDGTQTINAPSNGVIHVENLPAARSCVAGTGNRLGYPIVSDVWTYDCRSGDAFVEGTWDGRLTIGADNDVVITWHIDYAGTDDMLGLVASDDVAVYHPVRCQGNCVNRYVNLAAGPLHNAVLANPRVNAAVMAMNGSFMVQSWGRGGTNSGGCDPIGQLTLRGAIIQRFRGPTGGSTATQDSPFGGGGCTAYTLRLLHDTRFVNATPPSFPAPDSAEWRAVRVAEQFGVPAP